MGEPTECSSVNQGSCECGDTRIGFTTYTFYIDGQQRCFTVYRPPFTENIQLPAVITSNCYAKDALNGLNMVNDRSEANYAAGRYGYARLGLSTPDGAWTFGNNGVINDQNPMPCSDSDSKDIKYVKAVFAFLESNPNQYNANKVYAEGFSQNSMFSAYLSFCMNDKVIGIWQGGSGMSLTGLPPTLPGAEAQCTASAFQQYGHNCETMDPCTDCQYFPIYPCYQPQRPMINCVVEYSNDPVSTTDNPDQTTGKYMYHALVDEGHAARYLEFSPSDDGTIQGGHANPQNTAYWQAGCWGITQQCSVECEVEFIHCVNNMDVSTASARVVSFRRCIDDHVFSGLKGCVASCSPTLEMMKASEKPTTIWNGQYFGATLEAEAQPASSKCSAEDFTGSDEESTDGGNADETTTVADTSSPSTPAECNSANKGRCQCGDTSKGFTTYTFDVEGQQRCFTVYQPASETPLPVVITSQCYGTDSLNSIDMVNDKSEANTAAGRYGFARVGVSSPDGEWTFGNNGIVNDQNPMPCDDSDSKDFKYVKTIFAFLESNPSQFDSNRVYAEGFSQNSMFSAYLSFCMNDKVVGIWQGGSGMGLTGLPPTLPGAQAQCTASSFKQYGMDCVTKDPCTDCEYWPIYPCYQSQGPMIDCVVEYSNDPVSTDQTTGNPDQTTGKYMYNALVDEGHAVRYMPFSPSADGTIKGGHANPQNTAHWQAGCWGITAQCSSECESAFISCVNSLDVSTASARIQSFQRCIEEHAFSGLKGCTSSCSPTLEMMKASEEPTTIWNGQYFGLTLEKDPQPDSSKCSADLCT